MTRVREAAADRIAPWRGADWRIVILEGVVLIAAGVYLLADGQRGEFILGVVVAAALLVDGLRQWFVAFRRLGRGRARELTLIRGAVGIVAGGFVLGLSLLQQITVVGVRLAIGIGGLVYGLLGLAVAAPHIRARQANWTAIAYDLLLVVLAVLLLFRAATGDTLTNLLAVIAWIVIGTGALIALVGIGRHLVARSRDSGVPASSPPS
jgi:uncharacterized membrane protein HdeD (DUF308 family)